MEGVAWIFEIPESLTHLVSLREQATQAKGCQKAVRHNSKTYYIKKVILPPLWNEVYSLKQNSFLLFIIQAYYIFPTVNWDLWIKE